MDITDSDVGLGEKGWYIISSNPYRMIPAL